MDHTTRLGPAPRRGFCQVPLFGLSIWPLGVQRGPFGFHLSDELANTLDRLVVINPRGDRPAVLNLLVEFNALVTHGGLTSATAPVRSALRGHLEGLVVV